MNEKRLRIPEIDLLRGIAVMMMVFDHIAIDIWYFMPQCFTDFPGNGGTAKRIYRLAIDYWTWDVRAWIRYGVLILFFGLTGVCCSFSRSNLKRGAKLMGAALLLTAVTYGVGLFIDYPDCCIAFGALHCIAASLLLVGLLEKCKMQTRWFLFIGLLATAFGAYFAYGAPSVSYGDEPFILLFGKMLLGSVICGGDCFPLLLYCGIVFIGVYVGRVFYGRGKCLFPKLTERKSIVYLFGRYSLTVYLMHLVILSVLAVIILMLAGFTFSL